MLDLRSVTLRSFSDQGGENKREKRKKMTTSTYWGLEDLDILASDLDTSLSGLGGAAASTTFDMSEALSVLQVLKTTNENQDGKKPEVSVLSEKPEVSLHEKEGAHGAWNVFASPKPHSKAVKKPCREIVVELKDAERDPSISPSPEHQSQSEEGALMRVASAPSLSQSLYKSSFQPGVLVKESGVKTEFQYVLAAPTALGSKLGEETMTYLNQGQSYEIRLKKESGLSEMRGKLLKTVMRVGFQERRLQFREKAELLAWQNQRPWDRILDIDLALSYGIFDVRSDNKDINCCEFMWDPTREASVFIKINCISTEFTSKRKGGEKGVAFRIVIETYSNWEDPPKKLHAGSCLVKVFKAKGADRKRKTDKEKIEKLPQSEQRDLQPSYQFTVFSEWSTETEANFVRNCHSSSPQCLSNYSSAGGGGSSGEKSVKSEPQELLLNTDNSNSTRSPQSSSMLEDRMFHLQCKEEEEEVQVPSEEGISVHTSSTDVCTWLMRNRFSKYLSNFSSFDGRDLLCLTRDDVIEICGTADGIRLFNSLHARHVRPKLMLYFSPCEDKFHAICLESLTVKELKEQMCQVLNLQEDHFVSIFVVGPSGILVFLTDKLVQNMKNESVYMFRIANEDENEKLCIILQPYSNTPSSHSSVFCVADSGQNT